MKLEERLELFKEKIKTDDFLKCKGLGNEIPYWIFDYEPENELLVRDTISKLISGFESKHSIKIIEINLYNLCLKILNQKLTDEKLIKFEKKKGSDALLEKVRLILNQETTKKEISEILNVDYDLIFLTGIGNAWPMVRAHSILNNLYSVTGKKPLVLFYPGKFSGLDLSLFGEFKTKNYYRAFRLMPEAM
ncbi:hypothetical protein A9239_01980 [Methanosarcina sp. A14]|uniref:Putative cytoplasmic protein n=1 Tax=Methanosarcina barkeri MS TaxID=1434108 RepID=A0A0E3QXT1_METBA|nr:MULTISPECIES: DUF1788 domain-containing protein [Methanosarcina]AKB55573.1 putative cytoplasmic protein [Methanosarcina barkeri MS]OEC94427.1 hypothetical protein A9239_01980 [Methanosarcina sp. A14]